MKKQYIVYHVVDEKILLLLSNKYQWSGYLLQEYRLEDCVGILYLFEGEEKTLVEQLFFCKTEKGITAPDFIKKLCGPTWFPKYSLPLEEMDLLQKLVISFVIEQQSFKGEVYFKDKKRIQIQRSDVICCNFEDLLS